MAMIDIGIEIAYATGATKPTNFAAYTNKLDECMDMPALIQPSSKTAVDIIGKKYISEVNGKKNMSGLDFVFNYDGGQTGKQFRQLSDLDDDGTVIWFAVKYPDGTYFEMQCTIEVALTDVSGSALLQYNVSVIPQLNAENNEMIIINYAV
jgi:hypothetical protein